MNLLLSRKEDLLTTFQGTPSVFDMFRLLGIATNIIGHNIIGYELKLPTVDDKLLDKMVVWIYEINSSFGLINHNENIKNRHE